MAERDVCDCWDQIIKVSALFSMLKRDIGERQWKKVREETLPKLKDFINELEGCSGIELEGVRDALSNIEERFMPRYDWPAAVGTAMRMTNELIYDVGCRKVERKK